MNSLLRAYRVIEDLEAKLANTGVRELEPIAITGIGCRFPGGAHDPLSFWNLVKSGVDATRDLPANRWDSAAYFDPEPSAEGKMYVDRGGYLADDPALFDADFFGISPREAAAMDPQQRLLLMVAWEALEDAYIPADQLRNSETGVYIGLMTNDYARLQVQYNSVGRDSLYLGGGTGISFPAGRLSYTLGCQGPSMVVATACSSSLVAIHLAANALRSGECDLALAGGVNLILSPDTGVMLSRMRALSPDGRSKSFAAGADGYGRGEGCGVVVLKRLSNARCDRIYAVIRGSATNHDGASGGLTIPNGPAQEKLIRKAMAQANLTPEQVAYVEAHGTGTALGDPIEANVLGGLWREKSGARLSIGSVKSNIGHLEAAAGVAGVIKTALALHHATIPPSLHFDRPTPHIPWEELPLDVPVRCAEWPPNRPAAGVSSFGLSGINAHVVLERSPNPAQQPKGRRRSHHVLALSARSDGALKALAQRYADLLDSPDCPEWPQVASAANRGRAHMEYRLAVSTTSASKASISLRSGKLQARHAPVEPDSGVAFLFTGQGSQYSCMALALYESEPFFRDLIQRSDELLRPHMPRPLLEVLFPQPGFSTPLDETTYTQPALFAIEYALAQLWMRWGVEPRYVLGHSIGELAAACVAGVLSLEDGLTLAARRGQLMGSRPPQQSGMVTLFADESRVGSLLSEDLAIAAVNGPRHTVVSGDLAALSHLIMRCEALGIDSRRLTVSHGFHSQIMDAILPELDRAARDVRFLPPRIPIVSGLTGRWAGDEIATPEYWVRQARQAVRFADGVRLIHSAGCRHFVEVGPKPVLVQMAQAMIADPQCRWLGSLAAGKQDWETLNRSLVELYLDGFSIDWTAFVAESGPPAASLPKYPFQMKRYWLETAEAPQVPIKGHPLLGQRIHSPLNAVQYDSRIGVRRHPWLEDHRVSGQPWLPATAFWEMATAGGFELAGGPVRLAGAAIDRPCPLPADRDIQFQTILTPKPEHQFDFAIYSWDEGKSEWLRHSTGRIEPAGNALAGEDLESIRQRVHAPADIDALYVEALTRGVEYGPCFRALKGLWRGDREALAWIVLPEGLNTRQFMVHPVLLDAALQSAGLLLDDRASRPLPVSFESLHLAKQGLRQIWAHTRLVPGVAGGINLDFGFYDATGERIGELKGLFAREVKDTSSDLALDWLYTTTWEPGRRANQQQPFMPSDAEIAGAVTPRWDSWDVAGYEKRQAALDSRACMWAVSALQLVKVEDVAQRHRRLFERLREIAREERNGLPARSDESDGPNGSVAMKLLDRCGEALPAVLRGDVEPLALLFPSDGQPAASQLYETDLASVAMNFVARECLGRIAERLLAGRIIRILETGAGTGATTPHLLSVLPPQRTEYWFTDVSTYFTERAKKSFRDFPFIKTGLYDLEKDPIAQGFEENSFDVIVAPNVLHVVSDLRESLARLHRLLAPGGILVIIEGTEPVRWLDLIFGLTDGWWNFSDTSLRPNYPLLSKDRWLQLLRETGFTAHPAGSFGPQTLFLAGKAEREPAFPEFEQGLWLIAADRQGIGDALAVRLREHGATVLTLLEGDRYGQIDRDRFEIPSRSSAAVQLFCLEKIAASREPLRGVVYLWPLDCPAAESPDPNLCAPLLHLIRNLLRNNRLARTWIATREAMAVLPSDRLTGWDQAPLWSLAQVATLEHPDLQVTCLDLERGDAEAQAAQIFWELASPSNEYQIAYRGKDRYVARLAPSARETPSQLKRPDMPSALEKPASGNLDDLTLLPCSRRAPRAGELEIEVRVAGLNFLDVLDVLGALPFERGWLGGECAGVVTAVGDGVDAFQAGDEVVALCAGAFADYVVVDARLTARKPRSLTFAQAATFPVTFLTAHLALHEVGRIQPGERILIHAISGGTGLAAWQLARRAGAEVFGTASPAKWPMLRDLGILQLMNSRTLDFAAEIAVRTQGRGVDIVLNSLTGLFIPAGLRALAPQGRFLEIGKAEILSPEQVAAIRADVHYHAVDFFGFVRDNPDAAGELLRHFAARFDDGSLDPLPVTEFPIEQSVAAFRTMQQARHIGKIAISMSRANRGLNPDATYLITGGLSDLGLLTSDWLVDHGARNVVLASRRVANAEAQDRIVALERKDCRVTVAQVDISDRKAVAELLARIDCGNPPLRGIVHAAGILDDGILSDLEWPRFSRVLEPKVDGSWNLHSLTRHKPLDFFVAYSSVASVFGSAGQANHAAANRFLDSLMTVRRREGLPGLSINWAAWSEMGGSARVAAATLERGERIGQGSITTAKGRSLLDHLWNQPTPVIAVAPIDWSRFAERVAGQPFYEKFIHPHETASAAKARASGLEGLRGELLFRRVDELVLGEMRAVLGQGADWTPDEEQGFFGFGMDSLTSLELRNRLQTILGRPLPSTLLFDHPSPAKLVRFLVGLVGEQEAAQKIGAPAAVDELSELNTEDLAKLLAEQLSAMN